MGYRVIGCICRGEVNALKIKKNKTQGADSMMNYRMAVLLYWLSQIIFITVLLSRSVPVNA